MGINHTGATKINMLSKEPQVHIDKKIQQGNKTFISIPLRKCNILIYIWGGIYKLILFKSTSEISRISKSIDKLVVV